MGYLCNAHMERLAAMLRQVEDEAAMLTAVPSMAIRTGSGGGSLKSERAPARLDVLVHTDHRRGTGMSETDDDALAAGRTLPILDVLSSWARIVREERDLAIPTRPGLLHLGGYRGPVCANPCEHATCQSIAVHVLIPIPATISGERDLLSRHLGWVAGQPWVDDAYKEIRDVLGQLKGVNGTQDEKPVGRCYLPIPDGICDGPIWVDTAMGHAHCGRCQQTWDGPQLAMLSFELEQARAEAARPKTEDGRRMLTAQEMADRLGTTAVNVRKMASRQQIRAVLGHYDPDRFQERMSA